jgi:hypothetical protein
MKKEGFKSELRKKGILILTINEKTYAPTGPLRETLGQDLKMS